MTDSHRIREEAALRRFELLLGVIGKDDVIAWADASILASTDDSRALVHEVSLAGSKSVGEIELLLRELSEGIDGATVATASESAFCRFAAMLHDELEADTSSSDEVARRLYEAAWQKGLGLILPGDYADFCNWVDDEFALVRQTIKERPQAEQKLRDFLVRLKAMCGRYQGTPP